MRLYAALTVIAITWLVAANAAIESKGPVMFTVFFLVTCLCAVTGAAILAPIERNRK